MNTFFKNFPQNIDSKNDPYQDGQEYSNGDQIKIVTPIKIHICQGNRQFNGQE